MDTTKTRYCDRCCTRPALQGKPLCEECQKAEDRVKERYSLETTKLRGGRRWLNLWTK